MSDDGSSSPEFPQMEQRGNDDSDEAEVEDEDDDTGNEFNDDSDEYDDSDGECGDTRCFKQMKHFCYINIKNLSRAVPCDFVSRAGWRAFGVCLRCPDSAVVELYACNSNAWFRESGETNALLNDDTLVALAESVAKNSSLKELYMDGSNCSSQGWTRFFNMLRRHTQCSLEVIQLSKGDVDDAGWRALSCVLCDKSSIERTYTSNHTLRTISLTTRRGEEEDYPSRWETPEIPDHVVASLLRLNSERDKTVVARHKILTHHFHSDSTSIQVFVGMSASTLPHAMEWIGRDNLGFSLMYRVVRGIPSLFEPKISSGSVGSKRKSLSLDE